MKGRKEITKRNIGGDQTRVKLLHSEDIDDLIASKINETTNNNNNNTNNNNNDDDWMIKIWNEINYRS